jgi:ABC-type antimicrobial peptide transport system permease subunit
MVMSTRTLHDILAALATIFGVVLGFIILTVISQLIHVRNPYWDIAIDLVPFAFLLVLVVGTIIHWAAVERRLRQIKRKEVR